MKFGELATPKPPPSAWVSQTRLLRFGLVLVLAFLSLVLLVISAALELVQPYIGGLWSLVVRVLSPFTLLISFWVTASLFAVIYKMLPQTQLAWQDAWFGALFTAILFSLGKYILVVYLGSSGAASSLGAAGSIIALLLWVYYSAQIFFFGAEFTKLYALQFGSLRKLTCLLQYHPEPEKKAFLS